MNSEADNLETHAPSITRRAFLHAAAVAAAAPGLGALAAEAVPPPPTGLPRRILGKTGQEVTILGLGCAYLTMDKEHRNHRAGEAYTRALIETALDGGIRYFDVAPNYHQAEVRLGPLLAPVRDKVFLVTKLDHADARGAEEDLTRSLKLLQTDHVDLLLLHAVGLSTFEDLEALQGPRSALAFLRQARQKGLTRFIGFSSHPAQIPEQVKLLSDLGADVIQPFINYLSRAENNLEETLVAAAHQQKLGVVAMKVLGGQGQLADDYDRAFRYALSVPGVQCALIGASSIAEVQRAVKAARDFRPLTAIEMAETIALGRKMLGGNPKKTAQLRLHYPRDLGEVRWA
ncbi:MAG: aldo/keto reductase [Verrucomicrobiota bacterium]